VGSLFRQQYTVTDKKTGKRVRRKSKKWYIQWRGADGIYHREPAFTDRLASQTLLAQKIRESEREAVGIFDHLTPHMKRPISEHIADFRQHIINRGKGESHARTQFNRVSWVCEHGGITRIIDLTADRVDAALAKLVNPPENLREAGAGDVGQRARHLRKPRSATTRNHYLRAIKTFAKWLVDQRRSPDNMLTGMQAGSTKGLETFVRRPLTEAEFATLVKYAASAAPLAGMEGGERAILYIVAAYTGLRRKELSTLTPESFTFDDSSGDAGVAIGAREAKGRRLDLLPLKASVAELLRHHLPRKPRREPVWPIGDKRTADIIRTDLVSCGISPFAEGRTGEPPIVVDFHSLRSTFVTGLARAGVLPAIAQKLARHSTIDLTMNVYAKLTSDERATAVQTLPELSAALTQSLTRNLTQATRK
jgi:integrase